MIVIVDYGVGNLGSIANMLRKVGGEAVVSSDGAVIEQAQKLILPGVGAFDSGMKNLNQAGLIPLLNRKVLDEKTPILGLCLGMQLFARRSEEGVLPGLDWIGSDVTRFRFDPHGTTLKIPHMGWNNVKTERKHPLWKDFDTDGRFYFVHSYHLVCDDRNSILATTLYGYEFVSAVARDNILGVQFHPEKSHKFGMRLLSNFVEYTFGV